ncbi:MAG: UDP-N-acetylglucosamine pyrophosphorylase [Candidatus Coproplasma sp.]
MYSVTDILDLSHTLAGDYLKNFTYPWEALNGIEKLIVRLSERLGADYVKTGEGVWVHKTAVVAPTAYIGAWTVIGARTQVRHCAYIRGNALIGEDCVVGNSTELKKAILFDGVQVPHFNYVGDSILGYKSHMGAGAITSNVKQDRTAIAVNGDKVIDTGLRKFGAVLGDFVEIGCNSVLNPGTVIGRNTSVYPLTSVRGVIPADSIVKSGAYKIINKR